MVYRDRIDIINSILGTANGGGVTKTKIMYQAFLSYGQMKEFLSVLTQNNLLNHDVHTQTFKTTEKGLKFLEIYNQMSDVMKTEQNQTMVNPKERPFVIK
ncbi:MAG: winged helix-turn-helix domain-containing protein [Thermoproteota archaeon]|nr:winged helix-turn-helix domain-containing protein [Thermoproteota archaeon]